MGLKAIRLLCLFLISGWLGAAVAQDEAQGSEEAESVAKVSPASRSGFSTGLGEWALARRYPGSGGKHTCGVKSDGSVECWGENNHGQSSPPSDTFWRLSAGYFHTCGVTSHGTVECWGNDGNGQATPP